MKLNTNSNIYTFVYMTVVRSKWTTRTLTLQRSITRSYRTR